MLSLTTSISMPILVFFLATLASNEVETNRQPHQTLSTYSNQSYEFGRTAAGAILCAMDPEPLVARQTGLQISASLWDAQNPEVILTELTGFGHGVTEFKQEFNQSSLADKTSMCAFAWLGWRSTRNASRLSTTQPNLDEVLDLTRQTASIHGWAWACQNLSRSSLDYAPLISRQASSSFALSALSSMSLDDLILAHQTWAQEFAKTLTAPELSEDSCDNIVKTLPILSVAYEKKARLEKELSIARSAKNKLAGKGT
jgi:hypothetical protein